MLDSDSFYRQAFGVTLIDYLVMLKRGEVSDMRRLSSKAVPPSVPNLPGPRCSSSDIGTYIGYRISHPVRLGILNRSVL